MKLLATVLGVFVLAAGLSFIFPRTAEVPTEEKAVSQSIFDSPYFNFFGKDKTTSSSASTSVPGETQTGNQAVLSAGDIEIQSQLANPPSSANGIYVTAWIAGIPSRMETLIKKMKSRDLNAVVVDVKDYSGYVSYEMDIEGVKESGANREIRIRYPNQLIKMLHDNGIYAIARVTVFQDSILAKAHPEWAVKTQAGSLWKDSSKLAWMDPASREVWDYNIAIGKDALARGFDEVNFDYIRFPSDGDLSSTVYPFWDKKTSRSEIIGRFFEYMRKEMGEAKLSADVFGLTTVNSDDMGIGQVIESAYAYFDYVSPMVYPSHFAPGFIGFKNPAQHPYEVIKYSMEKALARLKAMGASQASSTVPASNKLPARGKLRPWLQAFDMGATYDSGMVNEQIRATEEILVGGQDGGWLLWDPGNSYRSI